MSITKDTTEMFIEKVRKHPILYDLNNPGYKKVSKKDKIWDSLGLMFQMDGYAVKKKWKNLRDTYAKYLKSTKTRTGQAKKNRLGEWQWAEEMIFLKPYLNLGKRIKNCDSSENESAVQSGMKNDTLNNDDSELESEPITAIYVSHDDTFDTQDTSPVNTPPGSRSCEYSFLKNNKNNQSVNEALEYYESKSQKRSHSEMDDLEHIFLGYAKSAKKLSLRRQAIIKVKLAQLIAEQELSEIEENTGVISPYDSS